MQRAGSKNSLYASRSSLYDRRRRRKGSYSESVVSYRDDMSRGYRSYSDEEDFDGYEKPLSRRDRDRMYKSDNDLGKRVREISTQTLRETATQTGAGQAVIVQSPKVVKKRRKPRSVSTSGTQTIKKESKSKSRSTERLNEKDSDKPRRTKTKRSKSTNAIDAMDSESSDKSEKPKPKPKPKPRKSTSADTHLEDQTDNPGSQENTEEPTKNPYYPGSEGYPVQGYPPQGYPMMPPVPPGYQGQPGIPMQQYPSYPMNGVTQGYPGFQAAQPAAPQMVNTSTPKQNIPRQRNKSNWEMLCEVTGQKPRDDITETGSVASSVFTNNPMSDYGNPTGNPYYSNQGFYSYQSPPQGYPVQHNSVPDYENTDFQGGASQPAPKKQSSWDTLKGLTEQDASTAYPGRRQDRNESVV